MFYSNIQHSNRVYTIYTVRQCSEFPNGAIFCMEDGPSSLKIVLASSRLYQHRINTGDDGVDFEVLALSLVSTAKEELIFPGRIS